MYIALAREIGHLIPPDVSFQYKGGIGGASSTAERGLLSAAIVSAAQLSVSGYESETVASNKSQGMIRLLRELFLESDRRNGWEHGASKAIFEKQVRTTRDSFIAHFDGNVSEYKETIDDGDGSIETTWRPPNPYFSVESFADLEKVLHKMERALIAAFFDQHTFGKSDGSVD